MRIAIASLILATGLAGAAQAQPATGAAPAAAAPPAAPASPAAVAQPAAPAAAPAAPAEAPPTLPTSGDGAEVIQAIEKICIPAVRGQGIDAVAKAAKLRANRRDGTWSMPLSSGRDYAIVFQPQYSQTNLCQAEVRFAVGQDAPIVSALNIWGFLQNPRMAMQANYVAVDADGVKRTRRSWETPAGSSPTRAVNFSVQRTPADAPLNPKFDSAMLFYQERK